MAVANFVTEPVDAARLHLPDPAEMNALLSTPLANGTAGTIADALPVEG